MIIIIIAFPSPKSIFTGYSMYSGSQKSEVCPMPYALCPMPMSTSSF
ncbi:MAG: hypothetical protein WBL95_09595 [Microcoleus sp.]